MKDEESLAAVELRCEKFRAASPETGNKECFRYRAQGAKAQIG